MNTVHSVGTEDQPTGLRFGSMCFHFLERGRQTQAEPGVTDDLEICRRGGLPAVSKLFQLFAMAWPEYMDLKDEMRGGQ